MRLFILLITVLITALGGEAQNTASVGSPVIHEGDIAVGYRAAYDPETSGLAQRVHYDHALNGAFLLRGVVQARKTADSDVDLDYVQAELRWQATPDGQAWQSGLRLDARVRADDRPGLFAVHWMNEVALSPKVQARLIGIAGAETGNNAQDGILLQTRGALSYKLADGYKAGVQMFNIYGSTADMPELDQQTHQIGPYIEVPVGQKLTLHLGTLFALTEATPDTTLRLFLTQKF